MWECEACNKKTERLQIVWALSEVDILDYWCEACGNTGGHGYPKLTFIGTDQERRNYWEKEWRGYKDSDDVGAPMRKETEIDRLTRLYDWFRVERQHGELIACGGIFPAAEIKVGQRWQGSSGHTVTVENVDSHSVYYSWSDRGTPRTHDKEHFAFQCRYCLILTPNQ